MRARTVSRGSASPASIMPSIAAVTASPFMRMKSTSVLSRSNTMAWIMAAPRRAPPPATRSRAGRSLRRGPDRAAQRDLAVVDPQVETAGRIAADPGLVGDGRSIPTIVGKRQQHAVLALSAFGEMRLHPDLLP